MKASDVEQLLDAACAITGLRAGLLDIDTVQSRSWLAIMESDERARTQAALADDARWLREGGEA